MKLVVITPVGPGHEKYIQRSRDAVAAMELGSFSSIHHEVIDDTEGKLGRSKARNIGMIDADWYFFVDADDVVYPDAARYIDQTYPATFGNIVFNGVIARRNVYPCGWRELYTHYSSGTLAMGFFIKAELAQSLRFNEEMHIAEDYDFYMRLPKFIKVNKSLVSIDYFPGKGELSDWGGECRKVINKYRKEKVETILRARHAAE